MGYLRFFEKYEFLFFSNFSSIPLLCTPRYEIKFDLKFCKKGVY